MKALNCDDSRSVWSIMRWSSRLSVRRIFLEIDEFKVSPVLSPLECVEATNLILSLNYNSYGVYVPIEKWWDLSIFSEFWHRWRWINGTSTLGGSSHCDARRAFTFLLGTEAVVASRRLPHFGHRESGLSRPCSVFEFCEWVCWWNDVKRDTTKLGKALLRLSKLWQHGSKIHFCPCSYSGRFAKRCSMDFEPYTDRTERCAEELPLHILQHFLCSFGSSFLLCGCWWKWAYRCGGQWKSCFECGIGQKEKPYKSQVLVQFSFADKSLTNSHAGKLSQIGFVSWLPGVQSSFWSWQWSRWWVNQKKGLWRTSEKSWRSLWSPSFQARPRPESRATLPAVELPSEGHGRPRCRFLSFPGFQRPTWRLENCFKNA